MTDQDFELIENFITKKDPSMDLNLTKEKPKPVQCKNCFHYDIWYGDPSHSCLIDGEFRDPDELRECESFCEHLKGDNDD